MVRVMNKEKLQQQLKKYFGFEHFKTGQEEVLTNLFDNQSTLAILPTGTGKSLCYQLYGKITNQRVLIVSPLISLMQDQVEQMKYSKIKDVVAITSQLSKQEREYVLQNLIEYQFIFVSPEILQNKLILNRIKQLDIGLMVVDEAHCIAKWGPDFRPDYLILGQIRKILGNPLTLALTATATPEVEDTIKKQLRLEDNSKTVHYSIDRPNIFLNVQEVQNEQMKKKRLIELVDTLQGPGLIYFSSKRKADEIAEILNHRTNLKVAAYHAGLELGDRFSIQHQFIENQLDLICATSAFGMGVNKSDIRYVIHYHVPPDLESYVQEIGRAGRDGQQSIAILLYALGDERLQSSMQMETIPSNQEIKYFYHHPDILTTIQDENHQFLRSFINAKISLPRLEQFFMEHRQNKEKALDQMLSYVQTSQCKRQFILKAFKESNPSQHNEKCCQNGLVNVKALNLVKQQVNGSLDNDSVKDYRQILVELFHR